MAGNYILYMHINNFNNKKYIGITCQKPQQRWNNGKGYKSCPLFYNAILKYGWNNFEHKILFKNLNRGNAEKLEQIYITKIYKTNNTKFGYNIQNGGRARRVSEAEKEEKRKTKGIDNCRNRKVYQYDLNGNFLKEFYSLENARISINVKNSSHISQCCSNNRQKAYGYKWSYDKQNKLPKYERHRVQTEQTRVKISKTNKENYIEKTIIGIDKNNVVYEFKNRKEALDWLSKNKNIKANFDSIKRCINKKRKSCYAMTWRYMDEWFN